MGRGKYRVLLRLSCMTIFVALAGCAVWHGSTSTKFEIFFAAGSSELSPSTKAIVDKAAAAIKANRPKSVVIGAGGSTKGVALGETRFKVVRDALVADGVNQATIVQANLPVEKMKDDAIAELRVEIQLIQD